MTPERKIEAAMEDYFRSEDGWSLDVRSATGDHFAICSVSSGPYPPAQVTVNLTECAKRIVRELGQ